MPLLNKINITIVKIKDIKILSVIYLKCFTKKSLKFHRRLIIKYSKGAITFGIILLNKNLSIW